MDSKRSVLVPHRDVIIGDLVRQHCEDSAMLYGLRITLTRAPQFTLPDLRAFDERLAAHLEGLAVAGEQAWPFCDAALESPSFGSVFTAGVRAFDERHQIRLDRLFALAAALPGTLTSLASSAGWLERDRLQGLVATLLASENPSKQVVGIAACAMHRVDPGLSTVGWTRNPNPLVRARAVRVAGELGQREMLWNCVSSMEDRDQDTSFWAGWSAALLGDRNRSVDELTRMALAGAGHSVRALTLVLQVLSPNLAHRLLQRLASGANELRLLIQGSGVVGDPTYVPWLIRHMRKLETARVAGEAFSLITGADLPSLSLDATQRQDFESGPNDDPDDPNVDMDPDDGLPWPDPDRVERWWAVNSSRFQLGARYFIGAPVTREHCIDVLKNGYQRQRILAAHYLCLLEPGTPLFNTSAPAWRQQRLLAQMT